VRDLLSPNEKPGPSREPVEFRRKVKVNVWAVVAGVLFLLLAGVWLLARDMARKNNDQMRDRFRSYSIETLECMGHNSESYCVSVYE
jgi:hypothetical protein